MDETPFKRRRTGGDRAPLVAAARVGGVYALLAGLWIAFSDRALATLLDDPARITTWQTYKGWAFVLASGTLVAALVYREVRRAEESESRIRSLVDQSLAGIYAIRDGRFLYVNRRLAEIFGYGRDEMLEEVGVDDVVVPGDRDLVRANLERRERGAAEALRYEFTGRRKNGEEIAVEVFGRRVELKDGPAVMGVLLDNTERKRLKERLRRAQHMEALGQLTGSVAHDFNNLLTAIIAPLDMSIRELEPDDDLRAELVEVRRTAGRAADLTGQLLAFSRRQIDRPVVLDLDEKLAQLAPMLRRLLPEGIDLRLELGDPEENLRIDPSALEQVVVNLVVNARDAMPEGGTVTIRTSRVSDVPEGSRFGPQIHPGPYLRLAVRDTGAGLDPGAQEEIFEPFFTTKPNGTGLGLATVFGLATKAGGGVRVCSPPDEGATFEIYLPAVDQPVTPREERERPHVPPQEERHVLLVEDDERVRAVTAEALARLGYDVSTVSGVEAALDFGQESAGNVDLLLTDVMLQDGTGPQLARAYHAVRPETRVLFMSGYSDEKAMREVGRMEGVTFMPKPFSLDELAEKVATAIEGSPPRTDA